MDIPVTIDGCDRADKTRFTCPAIKALEQFQVLFEIPDKLQAMDITDRIEVEHKCVNRATTGECSNPAGYKAACWKTTSIGDS